MLQKMKALQGQPMKGQPIVPPGGTSGKHSPWDFLAMMSPASWLFKGGRQAASRGLSGLGQGLGQMWNGLPAQGMTLPTQTPQGMQLLSQLMSQGQQNTDFGGIENMYKKQFNEETIPGLAERFSSMGQQGAQHGSEFQGALGRAGSDLGAQLAALRSQYGLKQSALGLSPQFENFFEGRQPGMSSQIAQLMPFLAKMGITGLSGGMGGF